MSSVWGLLVWEFTKLDTIVWDKVSDFRGSLGTGREVTQEGRREAVAWGTKGTHSWGTRATHSWVTETTHEWVVGGGYEWGAF